MIRDSGLLFLATLCKFSVAFWVENNACVDTKSTLLLHKFDFTTAQIRTKSVHIFRRTAHNKSPQRKHIITANPLQQQAIQVEQEAIKITELPVSATRQRRKVQQFAVFVRRTLIPPSINMWRARRQSNDCHCQHSNSGLLGRAHCMATLTASSPGHDGTGMWLSISDKRAH